MSFRGWRLTTAALGTALLTGLTGLASTGTAAADTRDGGLDPTALQETLEAVHEAGMPGLYSAVRGGGETWRGAAGVADLRTGRPVHPEMRHRAGSITKSFLAAAVLQQVATGRVRLDAPIGRYLPEVVQGERGRTVTVRMLLNHTSGIADFVLPAFPSLAEGSAAELAEMRRTVPMVGPEGHVAGHYGLGVYAVDIPGCGRIWGHDGAVFGALTQAFVSTENDRQVSLGMNLSKYQRLDDNGNPLQHPIDEALATHLVTAGCPAPAAAARSADPLFAATLLTRD
ncbi:MAG: serine hydrolase [Streptosporangiales bacterium]|nr:serine hydrolase [Streptosporangiales bacterium]